MGDEHGRKVLAPGYACEEPSDVIKRVALGWKGERDGKSQPPDVGSTRSFNWERLKQPEADMDHCGIDLAIESSSVCVTDRRGKVLLERVIATEETALREVFAGRRPMRCLLEASPLAEWAADLLEGWRRSSGRCWSLW